MATSKLRLITTNDRSNVKKYRALSMSLNVPSGRYIAPGAIIMTQSTANSLTSTNYQPLYQQHKPSLSVRKSLSSTNRHLKLVKA